MYCIGNEGFIWFTTDSVEDCVSQARWERRQGEGGKLSVSKVDGDGDELWRVGIDGFLSLHEDSRPLVMHALGKSNLDARMLSRYILCDMQETLSIIAQMEMSGLVERLPDGLYALKCHQVTR